MTSAQSSPYSMISSLPSSPEQVSIDLKTKQGLSLSERPQDHPYFAFNDQTVTFLVENTLFTIHKYFFYRDSVVFRQMFLLPPPQGQVVEGMSRENPITLHGVSNLDFERFLKVLYPPTIGVDPLSTTDEWASVCEIADKYNFISIRELAVRKLLDIALPVDKVILGQRYAERQLLISGYREICCRYYGLTLDEGLRLGMEDVIQIGHVREAIREADYTFSRDFEIEEYFASRLPPRSAPE